MQQNQAITQYSREVGAFLVLPQLADIKTRIVRQLKQIIDDPAQIERVSSETGILVSELKRALTEFAQAERASFDLDQNSGRALVALLTTPQLRNLWEEFTSQVARLALDQQVISEIGKTHKIEETRLRDFGQNVLSLVGSTTTRSAGR